jgi:hypothetical protein
MQYALRGSRDLDVINRCPIASCPHTITVKVIAENAGPPIEIAMKYGIKNDKLWLARLIEEERREAALETMDELREF